jgi:hypothetical protein
MSPFEGLIWFARRHAWHLVPKLAGIVSLPFLLMGLMSTIPSVLSGAVTKSELKSSSSEKPSSQVLEPVKPVIDPQITKEKVAFEQKLRETETKLEQAKSARSVETEIVMLIPDGVLLRNGKKVCNRRYIYY